MSDYFCLSCRIITIIRPLIYWLTADGVQLWLPFQGVLRKRPLWSNCNTLRGVAVWCTGGRPSCVSFIVINGICIWRAKKRDFSSFFYPHLQSLHLISSLSLSVCPPLCCAKSNSGAERRDKYRWSCRGRRAHSSSYLYDTVWNLFWLRRRIPPW